MDLELEFENEDPLQADRKTVVARLGTRFDGREGGDAIGVGWARELPRPRRSEHCVVAIDKARQMIGLSVFIRDGGPEIAADLPFVSDAGVERTRILEVPREHKYIRMDYRARSNVVGQLSVQRRYSAVEV